MKDQPIDNKFKMKIEYILAIIILGIIIIGMFLLTKNSQQTNTTKTNTDNLSETQPIINLLPVDDIFHIKLNDKTYTIGGHWYITSLQRDGDNTLNCENKDCLIYRITNDTYTFYLSTLSIAKANNPIETTNEQISFKVLNKNVDFTFERISLDIHPSSSENSSTAKSDLKLYKQGYSKLDDNLYASTGLLNIDDSKVNADQINAFKDMLSNLK